MNTFDIPTSFSSAQRLLPRSGPWADGLCPKGETKRIQAAEKQIPGTGHWALPSPEQVYFHNLFIYSLCIMVKGAEIFQFFVDFSAFLYYSVCVKGNHVYTIQGGLFRRTGGMSCENNPNPLLHRHPGPPRGGGKPEGGGHRQNAPLQGDRKSVV